MKCPNCSNEVPETANVCGYCGQRLKSAAPPPSQPVYAEPAANRLSTPAMQGGVWWRFGALLLGAVLATIGGIIFNIPVSILLAFAAVVYWRNGRRSLGCLIGAVGLGLLMTFIAYLPILISSLLN